MKLLALFLLLPTLAFAEIQKGVTYTFSVEETKLNKSTLQHQETATILDEKEKMVLVERNYGAGEVYSYWTDRSKVDGEFLFGPGQIEKNCKGSTSVVTVPAGTFVTCPVFQNYYEDHGHYGTDTSVTTWYGPVLDGVVKVEITRTMLGDHRTSTYKKELQAISK